MHASKQLTQLNVLDVQYNNVQSFVCESFSETVFLNRSFTLQYFRVKEFDKDEDFDCLVVKDDKFDHFKSVITNFGILPATYPNSRQHSLFIETQDDINDDFLNTLQRLNGSLKKVCLAASVQQPQLLLSTLKAVDSIKEIYIYANTLSDNLSKEIMQLKYSSMKILSAKSFKSTANTVYVKKGIDMLLKSYNLFSSLCNLTFHNCKLHKEDLKLLQEVISNYGVVHVWSNIDLSYCSLGCAIEDLF